MPRFPLLALLIACAGASLAVAADAGHFVGRVALEWLEETAAHDKMRLLEDFGFEDASGKLWLAKRGHVVDGGCIPPLFQNLVGAVHRGRQRKAALVHDYFCRQQDEFWRDVHRMFYQASLASGVPAVEAKVMYLAVYAEAPRWEPKRSSCYSHCHAAAPELIWKPVVEADLRPVAEWIEQEDPPLEAIEERVNALTKKPGPHLFAQGH